MNILVFGNNRGFPIKHVPGWVRVKISYSQDSRFRQLFVFIIPFFLGYSQQPLLDWSLRQAGYRATATAAESPFRRRRHGCVDLGPGGFPAGSLRSRLGWGPALRRRFRRFQSHRHRQEAGVLVGAVNSELVEFFSERLKVDTTNSQMLFQIFHESEPSLVPGMRPWKDVLQHFFLGIENHLTH